MLRFVVRSDSWPPERWSHVRNGTLDNFLDHVRQLRLDLELLAASCRVVARRTAALLPNDVLEGQVEEIAQKHLGQLQKQVVPLGLLEDPVEHAPLLSRLDLDRGRLRALLIVAADICRPLAAAVAVRTGRRRTGAALVQVLSLAELVAQTPGERGRFRWLVIGDGQSWAKHRAGVARPRGCAGGRVGCLPQTRRPLH